MAQDPDLVWNRLHDRQRYTIVGERAVNCYHFLKRVATDYLVPNEHAFVRSNLEETHYHNRIERVYGAPAGEGEAEIDRAIVGERVRTEVTGYSNRLEFEFITNGIERRDATLYMTLTLGDELFHDDENTLVVRMTGHERSGGYFDLNNEHIWGAEGGGNGLLAVNPEAMERLRSHFIFFLENVLLGRHDGSWNDRARLQREWDQFFNEHMSYATMPGRIAALAMATDPRLGARAPNGLAALFHGELIPHLNAFRDLTHHEFTVANSGPYADLYREAQAARAAGQAGMVEDQRESRH